jgi:hypothetical protein
MTNIFQTRGTWSLAVWLLGAGLVAGCGAPESYSADPDAAVESPPGSGGRGAASGGAGGGWVTGSGGRGSWVTGSGGAVATGGAGGGWTGPGTGGSGSGGGVATGGTSGSDDPDLVLHYAFDESGGSLVADSASVAGSPRNGNVTTAGTGGGADFTTTHRVGSHAVSLMANGTTGGGYVTMAAVPKLAPTAMTISVWVYLKTDSPWVRVFDIGTGTSTNMMLTTHAAPWNVVRFSLTTPATGDQGINGTAALPTNSWHHVAVVLAAGAPYTGRLYVDGVEVGSNPAMTLHPSDLGLTGNNWLGRSQFSADRYFNGYLDDFRVYRRALNPEELAAIFALQ